ncbi:MAG: hypothetical protein RL732_1175 [Bacteroidota bacterium]
MQKSLLTLLVFFLFISANAQQRNHWRPFTTPGPINKHKSVGRLSFPTDFRLFDVDMEALRGELMAITGSSPLSRKTVVSLPNADGGIEDFELVEASNFEPSLQQRFPQIRAYSGRGITDRSATVKLSIDAEGVQTMVFRSGNANEFIEPYSQDKKVYAVFRSQRKPGALNWSCSTVDEPVVAAINEKVVSSGILAAGTSDGKLRTIRLAQSCNGEYANYFGATGPLQVGLVLAAFNATLTRCNGVYEKDLALHLNLIDSTTKVIYYNPSSDPYTTMSSWNNQLQTTLTNNIGEANYDIGHMFGASGGGGNAGCIGCVCTNGSKGSGITSPADAIPQGDNFDIDYVVHEVGHQLGANHTFSMNNEGTGRNKEVGSGITIMGYAGITSQDVAPHSIDIFHQTSIEQIQANLAGKTCPVVSSISTTNVAPVVAAMSNYTIPKSTPFALTGSATDANGDALTYCWEQNDNASSTQTGTSSVASITKATGPNWISFSPTPSPTRIFPRLSTILAGLNVTGPLSGGDAGANIEALSSVGRTLNFRLTVRDNAPYTSVAPVEVGQTAFTDVVVTVDGNSGPFAVTAPNTAVNWYSDSTYTVTWSVNNTNLAPVNCSSVKISLSIDTGKTFTTLVASTPNDGSETITLPTVKTTAARIKVEAIGNIFFDISNANFTIGDPPLCGDPSGLRSTAVGNNTATVSWNKVPNATSYTLGYKLSTSPTWTTLTAQADSFKVLSSLNQGSTYDWRVLATCSKGDGNTVTAQFTTTTPTCSSNYDTSTNGTLSGAKAIPFNTDIKGLINPSGDLDYYKFTITTAGTITITLTTLPADYDLRLYDASGKQVASSLKAGTTSESIAYTAAKGTYYVRVSGYGNVFNATSCYTLKVALGTAARSTGTDLIMETATGTGLVNEQGQSRLTVYPNPVQRILQLNLSRSAGATQVYLFDPNGQQLLHKRITGATSSLDLSALPAGIYLLKVTYGNGWNEERKLIKY